MGGRNDGHPYIIPRSFSTPDLLATAENSGWPQIHGSATPHSISHNIRQPNPGQHIFIPQPSYTQPPIDTYIAAPQQSFDPFDTSEYWSLVQSRFPTTPTLVFPMHETSNYPSPRSEGSRSARAGSQCGLFMASNISAKIPQDTSPTSERSAGSRGDGASIQELPRNSEGQLYCDLGTCATDPEVFTRKCEWK